MKGLTIRRKFTVTIATTSMILIVAILTVAALAMRMATIRELRKCVSEQNKTVS